MAGHTPGPRYQKAPKKITPFSFAWLTVPQKGEVPIFVRDIVGNDLFYRTIREDGTLNGQDLTLFLKSAQIRAATAHDFKLVVEKEADPVKDRMLSKFEISLPKPGGGFMQVGDLLDSRSSAIKLAREKWGADGRGRVRIVNEVKP